MDDTAQKERGTPDLVDCASICLRYAAYRIYNLDNRMGVPLSVLDQDKTLVRNAYQQILKAGYPVMADACHYWMRRGLVGMDQRSPHCIPYPPLHLGYPQSLEMQFRSTRLLMDLMWGGMRHDMNGMCERLQESDPKLVEDTVIKVPYCAAALMLGSGGLTVDRLLSPGVEGALFVGEPFFVKYVHIDQ